ncbi:uncharacterized protein LOC143055078 [Mytilus galloprovincialis]|uniref:uncharacterized protein LOC143055078 n=1 Tax=Mytilus galloprovincialis TaxID=29158 RepID=UPI003F7B9443
MNNPTSRMYFVFYVIILGIILTFNESYTGLVKGPKVCVKYVQDRLTDFCCFNYYRKDGLCHECENGTTTEDGIECRSCNEPFYGHKCKYRCMCESDQRCDPVSGCLDKTTTFFKIEMSSFLQSQNDSKLAKTSEANPSLTTIPKERSEASTGIQVLCYMIVAAGLAIWMIVCLKCSTSLPRMIGRKRSRQSTRHLPICQMQEVSNNCKNNR